MEVPACRACLATDTKLFSLQDDTLKKAFENLMGFRITLSIDLPADLCYVCKERVLTFTTFKNKCMGYQRLVIGQAKKATLTKDMLNYLRGYNQTLNLTQTETDIISYSGEDIETNFPKGVTYDIPPVPIDNSSVISKPELNVEDPFDSDKIYPVNNYNLNTINVDNLKVINTNNEFGGELVLLKFEVETEEVTPEIELVDVKKENDIQNDVNEGSDNLRELCNTNNQSVIAIEFKEENVKKIKLNKRNKTSVNKSEKTEKKTRKRKIQEVVKNCDKVKRKKTYKIHKNQQKQLNNTDDKEKIDEIEENFYKLVKEAQRTKRLENVFKGTKNPVLIRRKLTSYDLTRVVMTMKKYNMKIKMFSKEEQKERFLARKESPEYINASVQCKKCFKGFATEKAFASHNIQHEPSEKRRYKCDFCSLYYDRHSLHGHLLRTHEREISCLECGMVVNKSSAKPHFLHHKGVKYKCDPCDMEFYHITTYKNHLRTKHSDTRCNICNEMFNGNVGLAAHMNRHRYIAECDTCHIQFKDKQALEKHLVHCSETTEYRFCTWCGDSFKDQTELSEHFLTHKGETTYKCNRSKGRVQSEKDRVCVECGKVLQEKYLEYHMRRHHNDVPRKQIKSNQDSLVEPKSAAVYECDHCGKMFDTRRGICQHMDLHSDRRRYQCDLCPKAYRQSSSLAAHKSTAHKDARKLYKCTKCLRDFKVLNSLQVHMLSHTGEKPHVCTHCGKTFRQKASLSAHERTHTGERPYKCTLCPKAFRQSSHRSLHLLVHAGIKPHVCSTCGAAYREAANLRAHTRTAHLGLPAARRRRKLQPQQGDGASTSTEAVSQ